ncbi:rhodanese domain-containing protein CG4456-like [Anopheles albimanus]|uniref:rhodanese domain-containing protein CG4456-like n=1 Tax=Anopheles albimanus TaxID=7167 RepID=UPI00164150D7|nr:rhodanese domain-containing protein CG4456-like [Anopheles albimanus]
MSTVRLFWSRFIAPTVAKQWPALADAGRWSTMERIGSHGSPRSCFSAGITHRFDRSVIAPEQLATYDEIVQLANQPEADAPLLIDVREPAELEATGRIPTSINIPVGQVKTELELPATVFQAKYGRRKPSPTDAIIFCCRIGVRSGNAAHEAEQMGFKRVKNYVGSWLEYAEKQGLSS